MRRSKKKLAALVEGLEFRRLLATITVTSADDTGALTPGDGTVTLREAITAINNGNDLGDPDITAQNPAATNAFGTDDTIDFAIAGSGVQTITENPSLPFLTTSMTIDGYSQPGAAEATATTPATILIKLQGSATSGLIVEGINVTIKGLAIDGNNGYGIDLHSVADGATIAGNEISNNTSGGIHVNSDKSQIGGAAPADRNIISNNQGDGVYIQIGTGAVVEGNYIGTNAAGNAASANEGSGIVINTANNTIGGTAAGDGNLISGNMVNGIEVSGSTASENLVEGNFIGTDASGAAAIPNGTGINLSQLQDSVVQIGGTTPGAGNVISGNSGGGIGAGFSFSVTVQGNLIGVNAADTAALPNQDNGIAFDESGLQIGGTAAGAGNVISGNGADGVRVGDAGGTIQGNFIGTNPSGDMLGNGTHGIEFQDGDGAVGGQIPQAGNVIAFNKLAGVFSVGEEDEIRLNSIYSNGGLGIDRSSTGSDDGQAHNDPGDTDGIQNYPVLGSAISNGTNTTIQGALFTKANATLVIDFYSDVPNLPAAPEGKQYIGSQVVQTDSSGNATFNCTFPVSIASGQFVTSTATLLTNGGSFDEPTSEFSLAVGVQSSSSSTSTPPAISIGDVSMNEGNSGTTAFTFTISRSGDLSGPSTVQFATADGTAKVSDKDYQSQSNTIAFDPNQASKTITILVNGDTKVESNETFVVNLSNPTGATIAGAQATGTVLNDDTAPPPPPPPSTGSVTVITDPCDSSKKALDIIGTNNADTITVTKSGSSQGKAVVKIDGVNKGTFSFTGGIIVQGSGGNDNISIDSGITRSAYIWGGDGNDTVNGGGGNDIIFGQGNDDSLNGNGGRDILVGGDGTDKLNGGSGDDLLIAGDFKSTPTMAQLCSIQKEWTRTDKNYTYRVSHLTNGGGYNTIKLNSSTLFSSTTLKDSLTGGSDSDVFFAAMTGDKITDKASSETAVNIG